LKNKGFTYGLLIVVGIVWYQVFVRIKSNLSSDDVEVVEPMNNNISFKNIKKRKRIYIAANYRDPFLNSIKAQDKKDSIQKTGISVAPTPVIKEKRYVDWPKIKYHGFVRNTDSKKPRVIIEIDNYMYKLQVGESVLDNIMIIKADNEFVKVGYQKEIKIVYK
jgi:hypothetical protein